MDGGKSRKSNISSHVSDLILIYNEGRDHREENIAPVIWGSGLIKHIHRVIVHCNSFCREMLIPQKAKGTGWLQCNNNSDRLNGREKQLPCQPASASTVPTAEEKAPFGNRETKQNSRLKSTETEARGRRSVFRSASLQSILLELSSPAETAPAGTDAFGGQTQSIYCHGGSIALSSLLASSALETRKAVASRHACLGSGLPFAKLISFRVVSDFPKDKHLFGCQDRPQGKW